MVAGHLQEKNNFYYIVLSYKDETGKRRTKWESTGLPVKKNKKKAEALLQERRRNFIPPVTVAEIRLDEDILFADFMLKWLEVTKSTIQLTTYASYQGMVEHIIVPYFRKHSIKIIKITEFIKQTNFNQTVLDRNTRYNKKCTQILNKDIAGWKYIFLWVVITGY